MNISIILIVAIGLFWGIEGSESAFKENHNNISVIIANQSPGAKQELLPMSPVEDGFFKKIQSIAWHDAIATQWKKYRFSCFLLATVTGYGYLWYQLYKARNLLDNAQSWSCWKNHIAVDRLGSYSRDELSKELFIDIQERYINIDDPTDHLLPLAGFLPMLEKERRLLENYIWWSNKIITCRLQLIFPITSENIKEATEGVTRLKFIKSLFISWWAAHNSQHRTPIKF